MRRRFGRLVSLDTRDERYRMRRLLPAAADVVLPTRRTWRIASRALDQGRTGTCVGHAWRNFLRAAPVRTEHGGLSAYDIYRAAILKDPWTENDAEVAFSDGHPGLAYGTTVRAGAEAVTAAGHLASYVWAWDLPTVVTWVLMEGPVVMGTDWYASFNRPNTEGIITYRPGARPEGGHAWLLRGIDQRRSLALGTNSWGDGWGRSGDFLIPLADLDKLIREGGEACAAIEQRLRPTKG